MAIPFASQHTTSFPDALQQLGASLVVSTYQAGQLIILRPQGAVLNTHFCPLEKPMGLAFQGQRLAVGTAFQLAEYRNLPAVAPKVEGGDRHDACYLPRALQVTGDIDIHEMAYAEDGQLWLVNTRMSCLCTLDPAYSVVPRWRPPFITGYDLTDRCHLNGLALKDGRPAYATALGATDSAAGWRSNKAHGGLLMSVPDGRTVASGLSMPHSPRWHQGRLWLLESGAGTLVTIDPATGDKTVVAELPGFTRGLDFAGQYAFIGLSQVRETAVFAGLPLTARVAERQCGVWIVDTATGQTLAFVVFTGSVQEVFAVQLLPHRFPALLEMSDPLVRCSYALPDEALADVAPVDPVAARLAEASEHHRAQRFEDAIAGYRQVLAERPDHLPARYQLGMALAEAGHPAAAEVELRRTVEQQPQHAEAWNRLGLCRAEQGRWSEALVSYDAALDADRQYAAAHVNRARILLKLGRYQEGWEEWEWRRKMPEFPVIAGPQACWNGEPIEDKVLLVPTEQGEADVLLFARFLPLAARRCRKLILACPDTLRPLLAEVEGVAEARLPSAVALDSFDVYCPIASLPGVLGITLDNLPAAPYLSVPAYVSVPRLNAGDRRKIGVCWDGRATAIHGGADGYRPEALAPLLDIPGCAFFALQTALSREDSDWLAANGIVNLEPELTDHARTAALIQQLDLVISTDTVIAHLASALGKPVWLLLGPNPDWEWPHDRTDSPWYPTARLFIQAHRNDWTETVAGLRQILCQFTG